jgi:hypothetical protein
MNIQTATAVLVATGIIALGTLSLTQVSAYQGDATKVGPYHTEEREIAMDKVMTANDFDGWKKLMTEDGRTPGVLRRVDTNTEFLKFAEAHRLQDAGKTTEANAIRAELGLGNGMGTGGQRQGGGMGNHGSGSSFVDANKDGVCDNL